MTATIVPTPTPTPSAEAPTLPADRRSRATVSTLVSDTLVFARRNVEHIRQIPEKLFDVTLQPLMFVLLFAYVFGGAIDVGGNYREYLIGGILVQSLAFGMMGPGNSIATDLTEGVIDRFRTLPSSRAAYLLGHYVAELAGMVLAIAVLLGTGLIVGWRAHDGLADVAGAFVLLVLFASAMIWVGTWLGMMVRSADAVMGVGFVVVFPLTFVSNAFVPLDSLPHVLRTFAAWNPVSVMVAAIRDLFGNPAAPLSDPAWPLEHAVLAASLCSVAVLAVAVPMTLRRFRIRTAD